VAHVHASRIDAQEASLFRTMVESDLDFVLTCLTEPSVNTTTPERFVAYLESGSYRPA
jgi:hypothetical protein